jgi:hypothetical protein
MHTPSPTLAWLRRWLPVRLKRWLAARRPPTPASTAPARKRSFEDLDPAVESAQAALSTILDRHPQARQVFAQLALLEHGLTRLGARMLDRLSPRAREQMRRQLLSVATEAEARPVLDLLQPPAEAAEALEPETTQPPTTEFLPSRFDAPEIAEVDATTYFDAVRAWQDTLVEEEAEPAPQAPVGWQPTEPMPAFR